MFLILGGPLLRSGPSQKGAQLSWAFFLAAIMVCGIMLLHGQSFLSSVALILSTLAFILFKGHKKANDYRLLLMAVALIYLHSMLLSSYTSRSVSLSQTIVTAFLVLCVLSQFKTQLKPNSRSAIESFLLLGFLLAQSANMISGYVQNTARQTGFLLDYSQASFFLLLIYGYLYSTLLDKKGFHIITFLTFFAAFSSFSRTTNFLIAVFLLSLFIYRAFTKQRVITIFTAISIGCSLLAVHLLPVMKGQEAVDRGGLKHFSTLNSRTQYWDVTWEAIKEKPLTGHGLGNLQFLGVKDRHPNQKIFFSHNDYLQIWVELGAIWLILFLASTFYLLYSKRQITIKPLSIKGDLTQYISWVMLGCCAAYMTINFIISSLIFMLLIALFCVDLLCNEKD